MNTIKRYALIFLALLFFSQPSLAQLEIEEATLYPNGATLIAKAVTYVNKGKNFVGFLPKDVDRASLNLAPNCNSASIIGVDWASPEKTEAYKSLKAKLDRLYNELSVVEESAAFYEGLIKSLQEAYKNNRYLNYLPTRKSLLNFKASTWPRSRK